MAIIISKAHSPLVEECRIVEHLDRVLAGCCWEVLITRKNPDDSLGALRQAARSLTIMSASYMAEFVAETLRAVLTSQGAPLTDEENTHLLGANYWVQPIYQELLHAASGHNASVRASTALCNDCHSSHQTSLNISQPYDVVEITCRVRSWPTSPSLFTWQSVTKSLVFQYHVGVFQVMQTYPSLNSSGAFPFGRSTCVLSAFALLALDWSFEEQATLTLPPCTLWEAATWFGWCLFEFFAPLL